MSARAILLVVGILAAAALAQAADTRPPFAPYLKARDEGRTGTVTGDAFAEPTQPGGPAAPYGDVSVMLLPSAPDFEAELDRIRAGIRENARAYLAAAESVRAARAGLERDLIFSGGGELVRGEVTDAAGRFRFTDVPAGSWILLAWRNVPHSKSARHIPAREVGAFVGNTLTTGYDAIEHWRIALDVRAGESAAVRLHDRNVWLTAIREDRRTPEPKPATEGGSKRRQGTTGK